MKVLSPMSGSPAWGSGIRRRSPQSIWLWRLAVLEFRSCTGLGETETPLLEGTPKVSQALKPRAKQWLHRSLGQIYLKVLGVSWGGRGQLWTSAWARTFMAEALREYSTVWALPEVAILAPRPGPNQQPAGSSAGMPQAKQPTGWEHSPTHQQTGT